MKKDVLIFFSGIIIGFFVGGYYSYSDTLLCKVYKKQKKPMIVKL